MTHAPTKGILPVVALSLMTVVSAVSGLMVSLPSIAVETGASQTELTWIVDAYTVVFAGLLLLAGAVADKFGRRRVLASGLAIYVIANIVGMQLSDPQQLIAVRAFTGIGAAFIMPSTLSVITTSFSGEDRGKAIGVWVGVAGGGAIIGLFGTAFLLNYFSWHSFFALNLALAVIALIGTLRVIPESTDGAASGLDWVGGAMSVVAVGSVVFGIIEGPERGWSDARTVSALAVGLAFFAAFVVWEMHRLSPLLDPRLFSNRGFSAGAFAITIQFFCQFGFIFVGLQYLQYVAGFTAWEATTRLLILPFVMIPASRAAGHLSATVPQKKLGAAGAVVFALGMFTFTTMTTQFNLWHFWAGVALMAGGMAFTAVPATTAITSSLPNDKQGVASAVNDVSRELGSAIGIAVMGAALNGTYRSHLAPALAGLPSQVADNLQRSVAFVNIDPAVIVARNPQAQPLLAVWDQLTAAARSAFTDGMQQALQIAGATALFAALFVAVVAPRRLP